VYYEDTDAGGVVYHASYLKFMERARTEWLRAQGYSQSALRQNEGLIFAVTNLAINFHQAARIDEVLDIRTVLLSLGAASMEFRQRICNVHAVTLCDAEVKIACLDADKLKPRRLPACLRTELEYVN
jgi:acyl-CoA thioester hydrolase